LLPGAVMRTFLALGSVLGLTATATAEPLVQGGATEAGRIELRVGGQHELASSARFADETAANAVTLGAAYFPRANVQIGLGGSLGVLAARAGSQELHAHVTAFYRLPIVRVFGGVRAGAYRLEVANSDYMFDDRGARFALDLGFRIAMPRRRDARVFAEPSVTLSLVGSSSIHDERNATYPGWTRAVVLGVAVPVAF
jgi:hypothetical protein